MSKLSNGFRSFKEGLRANLLYDYWVAFKATFWEIFWGASVVGIPFGIYTLFSTPSRTAFLLYALYVVFIAGYYLWRPNHLRLIPKLKFGEVVVHRSPTTQTSGPNIGKAGPDRIYVLLQVECATEAPIYDCSGHIVRLLKWSGDDWLQTPIDEPLLLGWSTFDVTALNLHPGIPRMLCILYVEDGGSIRPWASNLVQRMLGFLDSLKPLDLLKLDIVVTAEDCPTIKTSLKFQMGKTWDSPNLS